MTTPTYSLAASILSNRRGSAISFATAIFNVGGLVGPAAVGSMLVLYGWPSPFSILGAAGGATSVIFLVSFSKLRRYDGRREEAERSYRNMMSTRSLLVLAIANFFADLAFVAYTSWIPKFLMTRFTVSGGTVVLLDTVFGVGIGVGGIGVLIAGALFDKIGGRKAAVIGGLPATALTYVLFSTGSLPSAILLVVVIGFFLNWFWALLTAMAQANTDKATRSEAISFVQTAGFVGAFLGPALAGLIGGASGISSSALIATITLPGLVYLLILIVLYRDPKF